MRVVDCRQNSMEWFMARCGRETASRICDVMATLKRGGEAAARVNYRTELLTERITGQPVDHYVSPAMKWGTEQEPFARTAYELLTGLVADQVGFIFHPEMDFSGASPDSLVGSDGGLEIKCPTTSTHIAWLTAGVVPEEHRDQCYWNMECAEREWWDFLSFDPRMPKHLQCFMRRLERDEERIKKLRTEVAKLDAEVDYLIAQLGAESILPPIESFMSVQQPKEKLSGRMERIGDFDVPVELMEVLGEEDWRA